jgi:hypothetical protein
MPPEFLVPVIITFIIVGLPVMGITLVKLAKIMKGEPSRKERRGPRSDQEEARAMQELHRTLTSLEKRIDSLETIVLDKPTS